MNGVIGESRIHLKNHHGKIHMSLLGSASKINGLIIDMLSNQLIIT